MRSLLVVLLLASSLPLHAQVAPTPPLGWNSWDSYGLSINEAEYKQNVEVLASKLKADGWLYAVVDEGWYLQNPDAKAGSFRFTLDAQGRYLPAPNRFPSAGSDAGFKSLAGYVHSLGLRFGIHIIRGIPREAVARNLPISGSRFHAAEAADKSDTCPWNGDNFGVKETAAGQAYYDSLAQLYAGWGLDFIKVDCIAADPYKGGEIRMISQALRKTGRPIVLSLSPGPAPLDKAAELMQYAQMWRISGDVWDHWAHDKTINFSQSVFQQFSVAAAWAKYSGSDHWPDADMLPIGYLGPRPGSGKARQSKLSHDEQQTMITGWAIFRSPLFIGANLTKLDSWTESLLTNTEVLAVNQHAAHQRQASADPRETVWLSRQDGSSAMYLGLFNLSDTAHTIHYPLQSIGLGKTSFAIRDLWNHRDMGDSDELTVDLRPHASALFLLK